MTSVSSVPALFEPDTLLHDLLAVSLTGVNLLRPLYGPAGELHDFAPEYLNPAAQRMTGLPEQPDGTTRTLFPDIFTNGVFDFYRRVFETGEAGRYDFNYQADGFDNYFHVAARRSGERLLVSFTDTSEQPRSAVETALRESQAAEKAARAEAELQRQRFYEVLMALPAPVATYQGPNHTYHFVNTAYRRYFPAQMLPGRSLREVLPETEALGVLAVMDRVYQTGEPSYQQELEVWLDFDGNGQPRQLFLNLFYHPLRNAQGHIDGLLDFSYDVTEQVLARRQLQQLNQELEAARTEAEAERQRLHEVLMRIPANIALLQGPQHIYGLINAEYERLFPARTMLGRPLREVIPELEGQGFYELFDRVYETGEPFYEAETEAWADFAGTGELQCRYYRTTFEPVRNAQGEVTEVLNFAVDITAQVEARQQVEQLNQELEVRVRARTHEALALQAELLVAAQAQVQAREAFYQVFEQTPALIALLRAPGHRFEYVNPAYQHLFAGRQLVGLDVAEAVPEAVEQGFVALLDRVYETGETYFGTEHLFVVPAQRGQPAYEAYFNFTYQAYQENGQTAGISLFAYNVTEQVRARQQGEAQRKLLHQLFMEAPAPIVILDGPELVFQLVNPAYQAIFPGRPLLGKAVLEALPELTDTAMPAILGQVYQTGETHVEYEQLLRMTRTPGGPVEDLYFRSIHQARRNAEGQVDGVLVFSNEVTEQVLARQEREAQQRKLYALFEQAPVGICVQAGPELVYEFVNPSYQRMVPNRVLMGRPMTEAFPEMAGTNIENLLRCVYETGETQHEHELLVPVARTDGGNELENRYFTVVYQARRDEHGRVNGVLSFVFEVTEQVLARRQVEESEQQVRVLVAAAPFPIGVYAGPEFHIRLANQAMLDGWGKGANVIGRRFTELLPELRNQAVFEQLHQVLTTGQPLYLRNQPLEVVMSGVPQLFYYNYSLMPLQDTQGQVYGILNTAADVTDLVLARRRADEAAAELRLLTAHAPAFLFRTDAAGHLIYLNDSFFEWIGVEPTQLATLDEAWAAVHPEDAVALHPGFMAAIGAQRPWESSPYRLRRHDGQYRWAFSRTQPVFDPEGQMVGHNGITLEIHDQVELQRQLQRTNADLDNFIYTASHDLKAPISNIEGLLLALEQEMPAAGRVGDVPKMLKMMQGAVERFKRTIAHLTDVSRLQKEYSQPSHQVALDAIIEEVQLDLAPLIRETQARVEVAVQACPAVTFSEKNLRSVVYNLLSNALKYRHPDRAPEVHVRCRSEDGYQVLEVQDNGLGLDLARGQDQLFAMFQRLHSHVEGTGIGLYMVKRMVENVGGHIEVQSQLGQGSTFAVYFPH